MRKGKRFLLALAGLVVLLAGLLCMNYTKPETVEHHREWAAEHGLPPPGPPIFLSGLGAIALGSGLFGFAMGRR